MPVKIINTSLFFIAIVGVVFAFLSGTEYRRWLTAHNRLAAKVGSFEVKDCSYSSLGRKRH